ncbi:CHASE3 domain-containing protein [Flavobacterium cellulosilyticum]|uniref:histidine kinase n=1 Tax=Flavobacterium cellulosilyticum TaxID=2541731 RepID=A0A4R5C226_9FLAO|nr:CHASE3 domain-containing protein [Flavobacterium cellulosilyticum]TDD93658.1 hypothetical protein E0F76_18650 [Flavobacterium cellulosilyticum]
MKTILLRKIILFSILIILANSLIGYSIYKNHQKDEEARQSLKISQGVIRYSNLILSHIKDIETSARGYVITHDSVFLNPFNRSSSNIHVSLDQLKFLALNNPGQRRRVDSLGSYMKKRLDFALQMIELRNNEGLTIAIDYVSSGIGKNYTDSIRKITNSINEEEGFILQQQKVANEQNQRSNTRFAITLFLLMSFFTISLLIAAINYLNQNKKKLLRASELVLANKELAFQNKEKEKRALELLSANQELSTTKNNLKRYIKGLEEMIAMTSHRVRQPIANILGLADILHQSHSSPLELKQIIIYIKESAFKLDVFTKELTDYMVNLNQKKK